MSEHSALNKGVLLGDVAGQLLRSHQRGLGLKRSFNLKVMGSYLKGLDMRETWARVPVTQILQSRGIREAKRSGDRLLQWSELRDDEDSSGDEGVFRGEVERYPCLICRLRQFTIVYVKHFSR